MRRLNLLKVLGLAGAAWPLFYQPAKAETGRLASQPDPESPTVNELGHPATSGAEWLTQVPTFEAASPIEITDVQITPTDSGLRLILTTSGEPLSPISPSVVGNALIADIPNAVLTLSGGDDFSVSSPADDIALVTVSNLPDNTVRVAVTGLNQAPIAEISSNETALAFDVVTSVGDDPDATETDAFESDDLRIVVTAERTPEDAQDVPISLTVLTPEEIEDADITSLEDISRNAPNFSVFSGTGSRNFTYYSIRGLSNFNFGSRDPIAFYVDDVPYDFGGFVDLDLTDLERVEILRGPQNTLYGRSSQSGVINIITRQPTNEFEFNGAVSYGNFNEFDIRSAISGPIIEDELFYRLSGSYGRRDGFYDNRFLEDEEFDEQSGGTGRAQLLWTPSDDWEISFNAGFDDYRDGAYPFVALDDDPFDIEQDFNGFINLNTDSQALRVTYRQPRFRVTSITTRRFSEQEGAGDLDFSIADVGQSVGGLDSTVFTQELRLQSPEEAEQLQWIVGGYFESREFDNNGAGSVLGEDAALLFPPPFAPGATSLQFADSRGTTLAAFGQASYSPIEPLTLTLGLRYEASDSTLESFEEVLTIPGSPDTTVAAFQDVDQTSEAWLPRFAVDYRLSPNATVYGSITRGYRPGGVNILANNEASLIFDAERSWNYELGAKTEWFGDRLGVNFALFYNPVEDYQVVTIEPITRLPANVSNADVSIWGLELEARATPIDGLDLIAGLGWVDAQFVDFIDESTGTDFDGNRIPYAPNLTYNLAAQYRSDSGIFGRLELQGVGTTFFDEANTLEQEPYAIVNMRLGYELDNYGFYLFANNLFDEEYISQAFSLGPDGSAAGSVGAPRTYGLQVRAKF